MLARVRAWWRRRRQPKLLPLPDTWERLRRVMQSE